MRGPSGPISLRNGDIIISTFAALPCRKDNREWAVRTKREGRLSCQVVEEYPQIFDSTTMFYNQLGRSWRPR
jgi:hypothetical protein